MSSQNLQMTGERLAAAILCSLLPSHFFCPMKLMCICNADNLLLSCLSVCCREGGAAAERTGLQNGGAVWDGSIFSVAERLEPGEGFGLPLADGAASQPTNAKASGVSFAALPASAGAVSPSGWAATRLGSCALRCAVRGRTATRLQPWTTTA